MITNTAPFWLLETNRTAYAFGLTPSGYLVHCYWGPRLGRPSDYPQPLTLGDWASFNGEGMLQREEYPAYGGTKYAEPCLKTTFADGVRDTVLVFESAEVVDEELRIHLRDSGEPLGVTLHYRVHAEQDVIERWVTLRNTGTEPIQVERALSALWHFPAGSTYRLSHLTGRWLDEFQLARETLTPGVKVLESRRLTTSHHHSPWFAVDQGAADECHGAVWFGALAWSGNWKLFAEITNFDSARIGLGLNDWDFQLRLKPGQPFRTPSVVGGFTEEGFGGASRLLHRYVREAVLPRGDAVHPVLYNSWEATFFDVDVASQSRLAEKAAEIGCELFVMDDGWFMGRNDDHAGLGDWTPDPAKFPDGLNPLIERVNALGMEFGLWVEPEMVNPNSDLYRAHPDWVIHFPQRARTESRNQLILNLARPEVQDHLIAVLDHLLTEHNIRFIKWDMNRNVSEPGWEGAEEPREIWLRYVEGVYRVWGTLRQRHPDVMWQSCSGGGGRADYAILRYADQIWTSDNTEATRRLGIQYGFSQLFPALAMEAWVTDAAEHRIPLEFRFRVSMLGSLGVGANLDKWGEEDVAVAQRCIAEYKELRHLIAQGDQYRLTDDPNGWFAAWQYVSRDRSEAVVFAFRVFHPDPVEQPGIVLQGLDADADYEMVGMGRKSGRAWMETRTLPMVGADNFTSRVFRIKRV